MKFKITCVIVLSLACSPFGYSQSSNLGVVKKAIICLTYDDGLNTQLTTALQQLDSAGLKGTFFLNSIQGSSQSDKIGQTPEAVIGWTTAARNGHELANHTLFHPCPEKLGWERSVSIDNYTVDRLINEIITQNTILAHLDPVRKTRSFAFPCNNVFIGSTDYSKLLKEKSLVTFGRVGGDSRSVITDFEHIDVMKVPSWHVLSGTSLEQLIGFAQKAKESSALAVYQFHGIDGQIFQITSSTHRAFLEYLKKHEADYWVTTFSEAMEYVTSKSSDNVNTVPKGK